MIDLNPYILLSLTTLISILGYFILEFKNKLSTLCAKVQAMEVREERLSSDLNNALKSMDRIENKLDKL